MSNYNRNFPQRPDQSSSQKPSQQFGGVGQGQHPFPGPQSAPSADGPNPPAPKKHRGLLVTLLVVGIVVVVAGSAGAYWFLGTDDEGTITAVESQSPGEGANDAPTVCDLSVESLGATIPSPGADWAPVESEAGDGYVSVDSTGCEVQHEDSKSYIESGALSPDAPYDPVDLGNTAAALATEWAGGEHITGAEAPGKGFGTTETRETEFEGRPAALATLRVTWDPIEGFADTYEDVSVLLVDVDGTSALVVLVSIPEGGEGLYESASEAVLAMTFTE